MLRRYADGLVMGVGLSLLAAEKGHGRWAPWMTVLLVVLIAEAVLLGWSAWRADR